DSLAPADACGRETTALPTSPQFQQQRQQQPRAGHAEGMTQRNGAAVDVYFFPVESELFFDRQVLPGKGLIDLDQIESVQTQSGPRQHLTRSGRRAHAHERRLDASRGPANEASNRLQAMAVDRFA